MKNTFKTTTCLLLIISLILGCSIEEDKNNDINMGALLPLTGNLASYGNSAKKGIELAVAQINDTSEIKIHAIFEDTRGLPKDAVSAYHKIKMTVKNLSCIIGPQTSSEVLSVSPICEKDKMPLISHAASSPQITYAGDYIFRIVPSDYYEAVVLAKHIIENTDYRDIAIIHINDDYGNGVAQKFREELIKYGVSIDNIISYNTNTTNFRTQLTKIKSDEPDAIYLIGFKELGYIVKQTRELNIHSQLFSNALFEDSDILTVAGPSAENLVFTTFFFDTESNDSRIQDFVNKYKSKYDEIPDGFAATGYDAVFLIFIASRKATNTEEIKDNFYLIQDFPGLLGDLSFDSNGDITLPIQLKTVKDNKFIKISKNQ